LTYRDECKRLSNTIDHMYKTGYSSIDSPSQEGRLGQTLLPDPKNFKDSVRQKLVLDPNREQLKALRFNESSDPSEKTSRSSRSVRRRVTCAVSKNVELSDRGLQLADGRLELIGSKPSPNLMLPKAKELAHSRSFVQEELSEPIRIEMPKNNLLRPKPERPAHQKPADFLPHLRAKDQAYDEPLIKLKAAAGKPASESGHALHREPHQADQPFKTSILDSFLIKQQAKKQRSQLNYSLDTSGKKPRNLTSNSFRGSSTKKEEMFTHLRQVDPSVIEKSLKANKKVIQYKGTLCVVDMALHDKLLKNLAKNKLGVKPEWTASPMLY
jgi:hypothetical protein